MATKASAEKSTQGEQEALAASSGRQQNGFVTSSRTSCISSWTPSSQGKHHKERLRQEEDPMETTQDGHETHGTRDSPLARR